MLPAAKPGAPGSAGAIDDKALLNGPQMPSAAMSQDDIDAILSGNA